MSSSFRLGIVVAACWMAVMACLRLPAREPDLVLSLWDRPAPGETRAQGPEHRVEGRPRPYYQLTEVTTPTLAVFQPPVALRNGTAVLVCPGGGLQRVAYEHEGLEVAEWLNAQGVTACVLKYRVPSPARTAAMDAQRALALIRSRAADWNLDPGSVGILGFSAGGEMAAWVLAQGGERLYPAVDAADQGSMRPDFAALVYPGGLLQRDGSLKEAVSRGMGAGWPPVFLVHAFDDSSNESLVLAQALKRTGVPTELHLYAAGGHGFGVRATGIPTGRWTDRWSEWADQLGYLDPAPIRAFARRVVSARAGAQAPPSFTEAVPGATLEEAYRAQHRTVRAIAATDPIAGFKVAAASAAAQKSMGIPGPLTGVLFRSGRLDGGESQVIPLRDGEAVVVETEVGYITSVDLSYEILTDEQARGAVVSVVPVIELPRSFPSSGPPDARNAVAANVGSHRYIVGRPVKAEGFDPDAVAIALKRDGVVVNQARGGDVAGGQWHNLRLALNSLTRQGHVLPAGSVILGGAVGKILPGDRGSYEADFGTLGRIAFELK